jgi:hypothetical protein
VMPRAAPSRKRTKAQLDKLKSTQHVLGLRLAGPFADVCTNCNEEGHFAAICPDEERRSV